MKSPVRQFMDVIWANQLQATGHSWTRLNWSLRGALKNGITAGLRFNPDDFKQIFDAMRGGYWFGTDNEESQGEGFYCVAVQWNNASACQSFEKWKGRKPFIFDGKRLACGSDFFWEGQSVRVTRMPASGERPMFACSFDYGGEKTKIKNRFAITYAQLRAEDRKRAKARLEAKRLIWVTEVYKMLCASQGEPQNDTEKKNLLEWAESMATGTDCNYFKEGYTPEDAHWEEMQAGA